MSERAIELLGTLLSNRALWLLDEQGRPLGEKAAPSLYQAAGVEERPCPYPDRRALTQKPMNVAALRQVSQCWRELIATLEALADAVSPDLAPGAPLSTHQAWLTLLLAFSLAPLSAHEHLPVARLWSAMFKTSLGYTTILPSLLLSQPGVADAPLLDALSPDEFFALTDAQEWLIGQTQVCAGSATFIQQSYAALARKPSKSIDLPAPLQCFDVMRLAHTLARTWSACLGAGVRVNQAIAQASAELPDVHLAPDRQQRDVWPICARATLASHPSRPFALPRAMPGLTLTHVDRLFPSGEAPHMPHCETLEAVDQVLYARCLALADALHTPLPATHDHRETLAAILLSPE